MNTVYLDVGFSDGKSPRVRYIICDSDSNPLSFDTQKNALVFWITYKSRFDIPVQYKRKFDNGIPRIAKEKDAFDEAYSLIEKKERKVLRPKSDYLLYSDAENAPTWCN